MNNTPIRLLVGLGNPGTQYAETRHNAGVWFVAQLARQLGASLQPQAKFHGELSKIKLNSHDVYFLFPTTYMNRSGLSVQAVMQFYKISPNEILVVHDELDLAPGQLKLKHGGGHAEHNGLRNIQEHIGTNTYWRARIGIGHPRQLGLSQSVADFVLHRPSADEHTRIQRCLTILNKHINLLFEGHLNQACTRVHTEVELALSPNNKPGV